MTLLLVENRENHQSKTMEIFLSRQWTTFEEDFFQYTIGLLSETCRTKIQNFGWEA